MANFNFRPFCGDPLTHRIIYTYPGNITVSSPANFKTDTEAIQAAEACRGDAVAVEVLKYGAAVPGSSWLPTSTIYKS